VTYDNAVLGYACGFNTNGDVTVNLVGTGRPGIHLVDFYPAIYRGKDRVPWNYQTPFLTYARDFRPCRTATDCRLIGLQSR
jgi:hypothetical protein